MEDRKFLRGAGRYLDDVKLPNSAVMLILRSPYAHARIAAMNCSQAEEVEGVIRILTAEDMAALDVRPLPCLAEIRTRDGVFLPSRPILARDRVRYVGEPVAAIIAETMNAARDAADIIEVDYEPLDAVVGIENALQGNDSLWPEAPDNIGFDWCSGDKEAVERAFEAAAHVISVEIENNRVAGLSLEPRGAIGQYDAGEERFTLHVSSQGGHAIRRIICQNVLNIPENRLRVITPDVGGGFGPKIFAYAEYVLVLVASRLTSRPVKWVSERMESLQSDTQGRAQNCSAELAVDETGRFLAMRFDYRADIGAYPGQHGPNLTTIAGDGLHPSVYDIGSVFVRVRGVFTNTVPVDSYRGAGRPEVIYAVERLVDEAAVRLKMDPAELRSLNFVKRERMPFRTITGQLYDDGDFQALLDKATVLFGYDGRERLKTDALKRGKLAGVGLAYFFDRCGRGMDEFAELRFDQSGSAILYVGSQSMGQGHETSYANIVARKLGLGRDSIRVVQGDTDQVAFGRGTGGSRAIAVGGNAVWLAAERAFDKARRIAAFSLKTDSENLAFDGGVFRKRGSNGSVSFQDCVKTSFVPALLPEDMEPGMSIPARFRPSNPTFPNGCHICCVEIDKETAAIDLVRYVAVNDVGTVLNRALVEGQFHGALAQGIGQALLEQVVYDADSGQIITGSLADYCYPKSDDFIDFELDFVEIPCRSNPMGVKGCGEAGAIAAPPTVANAVMDALRGYDVSGLQMPFTPQKLFRVLSRSAE